MSTYESPYTSRTNNAMAVTAAPTYAVVPDRAPTEGTLHGDLSQMTQRPFNGALYLGVLLVAAGIDIATFYQVLALVMKNVPDQVVWLGVVGFTATALALAHTIGVRIRERKDTGDHALGASVWLCAIVWLFVGITAFVVRMVGTVPSASGGTTIIEDGRAVAPAITGADSPMLAALLFLALYTATGTLAGVAGYLRHNTAAKAYRTSLRTRTVASKQAAQTVADVTLARQTKVALDEERQRREEAWVKTQEEWAAIARRLKQEARLRLAAAAQDPTTTDAYFIPPLRTMPYDGHLVSAPVSPVYAPAASELASDELATDADESAAWHEYADTDDAEAGYEPEPVERSGRYGPVGGYDDVPPQRPGSSAWPAPMPPTVGQSQSAGPFDRLAATRGRHAAPMNNHQHPEVDWVQ
jgi:hypothetical protein